MTREFAIDYLLDDCQDCPENKDGECMTESHCFEVKQMAINALKQEPCEDAVSRQAVLDAISRIGLFKSDTREVQAVAECLRAAEKLPFVMPTRPKGQWIGIDEEPHEDYECGRCGYVCSTFTANIKPSEEYKYCPNCGAEMKEGDA